MKDLVGKQWSEISEIEKEKLLKCANPINGISTNNTKSGECIVDFLGYDFSIKGLLISDEIIIADDAIFYNPIN